ncbi:hypothetical protein KI387_029513, partial [Taxus chinensis]
ALPEAPNKEDLENPVKVSMVVNEKEGSVKINIVPIEQFQSSKEAEIDNHLCIIKETSNKDGM